MLISVFVCASCAYLRAVCLMYHHVCCVHGPCCVVFLVLCVYMCVRVRVCACGCAEWEAVAMFDYVARSAAELSFKQGDHVLLHSKASADWWKGEVGGVKGLIPHKYISVPEG